MSGALAACAEDTTSAAQERRLPRGSDFASLAAMQGVHHSRGISRRIYPAQLGRRADAITGAVAVDAGAVERHTETPLFIYSHALREGNGL